MNYHLHINKRGQIFASLVEARAAASEVFNRTGRVIGITTTDKSPTHSYQVQS